MKGSVRMKLIFRIVDLVFVEFPKQKWGPLETIPEKAIPAPTPVPFHQKSWNPSPIPQRLRLLLRNYSIIFNNCYMSKSILMKSHMF